MTVARWKDLCIDAVDGPAMVGFWASALGLQRDPERPTRLAGPTAQHTVWINQVPEPVAVKQRVHLDLHARSVEEYVALGSRAISRPGEFPWTVLRDPEGGEFCVFARDEPPVQRLYEIVVACADPGPIAHWWGTAFGGTVVDDPQGYSWVEQIPGAPFTSMDFVPVPEPKTVKNRIHWDVLGAVSALEEAGATVLRVKDDEIGWTIMADPDGNEFCTFD